MSDISKLKVNNTTYDLKDTAARSGLDNKVDKIQGKSLSTNDYTNADKALVAEIAEKIDVLTPKTYVFNIPVTAWDEEGWAEIDVVNTYGYDIPASNYNEIILSKTHVNYWRQSNVQINTVDRDLTTGNITRIELFCDEDNIPTHSISFDVISSSVDNTSGSNLDRICLSPGLQVDTKLDSDSTNPIQNKAIAGALSNKVDKVNGKGLSTNDYTTAEKNKLAGISAGAEVNVQANWTQTTTTADDYIKNKPTLGTASAKDVPSSGNASTSQVVMGNDTRLSDARTPTSHTHTKSQITDFPSSLPASNTTDSYSSTGTAPVSGKAVAAALGTLDVSSVGGSGKYIQAISETDGKISATAATMPTSLPASNTTDTYSATGTAPVSGKAVAAALATLPEPMVFKGSVGTNGTVTTLPTDGSATVGDTYKVITAGTYAGQASKVGDTFICQTKTSSANTWVLIPSGDEPSGTVTSIATGTGLTGGTITSSGTISHADTSSQASVSNSGRTYIQSVTLDSMGHVTGLSSATETVTNTDTKVTSAANHYAPATATGSDISASATGASAAWSIDVVKGVTLNTDGKGHVTGMSVTSGKIPGNPNTDTKVTSAANHYAPTTATGSDVSASASGATAAWSIDVVKGVTLNTDGKGHVTGMSVTSGKIPANPNTDTKVTSSANHYTPSTASGSDKSASASGATAAWNIDVVKGVTLNTDGKGHVTGLSVTSGKVPANPNTDRYVNSATFASQGTNGADGSKMTLTRAGSDTATVTATIPVATTSAAGVMSGDMFKKLDGIEDGAQVNTVTSVAGKTGVVTLAKGDVGLGNVGNFKAVSTAASQGLTSTEQSNARANIGAGTSNLTIGTTATTAAAGNHNQASNTINAMTGYSKPSSTGAISTSDTLNSAIGKLEKGLDSKGTGTVTSVKVGSTSYSPSSGVVSLPAYPTSLPASNTTNSYSATGTVPVSGTAVAAALATLDVSSVGGSGKYIQSISETDGKISAVAANMPTSLPASNTTNSYSPTGTAPVSGKAVAEALGTMINDSAATSMSTYSSEKVEDLLAEAVPKKIDTASARPKLDEIGEAIDVTFLESILDGSNVWTDGKDIYYSSSGTHYIFDKATSTWSTKTWSGLTSFYGKYIWTDGENIYCSNSSNQYVLDKSTSTWSAKTWTGLTSFDGNKIWTDGENIYCSNSSNQYVLDKSTSTWSTKTWTGLTNLKGQYIWTDGENIYYSNNSEQYVLDKSTSTWSTKTWTGLTAFFGYHNWTDGENIYHSNGTGQYVLDKSTSTWSAKTWTGTGFISSGSFIWTDGENIYYSNTSSQKKLIPKPKIKSTKLR